MSKKWNVKVDEKTYEVELKNTKILVNQEATPLRKCLKKSGMLHNEYEVTVGSKKAMMVIGSMVGGTKLVIDGKDCATGEDYVPVKIPAWAYIFVVLHMINFINGMIGVLAAFVGCSATVSISTNSRFNALVKVLLNLVILVLAYVVVFGIAFAVASAI